jgi:hypothetical protein
MCAHCADSSFACLTRFAQHSGLVAFRKPPATLSRFPKPALGTAPLSRPEATLGSPLSYLFVWFVANPLARLLAARLPSAPVFGDFRVFRGSIFGCGAATLHFLRQCLLQFSRPVYSRLIRVNPRDPRFHFVRTSLDLLSAPPPLWDISGSGPSFLGRVQSNFSRWFFRRRRASGSFLGKLTSLLLNLHQVLRRQQGTTNNLFKINNLIHVVFLAFSVFGLHLKIWCWHLSSLRGSVDVTVWLVLPKIV